MKTQKITINMDNPTSGWTIQHLPPDQLTVKDILEKLKDVSLALPVYARDTVYEGPDGKYKVYSVDVEEDRVVIG